MATITAAKAKVLRLSELQKAVKAAGGEIPEECVDDLVEMSTRVKGVAHARLSMEGRFEALIQKDRLEAARKEIADHVAGYGFRARAGPAE